MLVHWDLSESLKSVVLVSARFIERGLSLHVHLGMREGPERWSNNATEDHISSRIVYLVLNTFVELNHVLNKESFKSFKPLRKDRPTKVECKRNNNKRI